ncbi:MAG: carbohydrate ABC transporter permease [Cellulomonadaceae bacterium]
MTTVPTTAPALSAPARTVRPDRQTGLWPRLATYAGVAVIVIWCLAPFYWMIVSSLRKASDIFSSSAIPAPVSLENYVAVFDPSRNFGRSIINSVIVAGTTTVLALVIAIATSYALARLQFPAKRFVLTIVIATSMFPIVAIIVPLLKLFTSWGWINTYQAMILPSLSFALPLAVWNLTTFFRQMPEELEHAAMIDGCTRGQAFRMIILPLAAPGVFTTAIIVFVAAWNEFLIALTMVNDPKMQTAPVAISKFVGATQFEQPFGSQMAAGVVVTIPLVILVLIFQRRVVAGLAAGGVKS